MPIFDLIDEKPDDPRLAVLFEDVLSRWPRVPNLYRTLGHAPAMLKGWIDLAWTLRLEAKTSRRVREMMILEGARISQTAYEWLHHVPMALEAGVSEAEVGAIERGTLPQTASVPEQAALRLAREISRGPAASSACMEEVRQHYSDEEVIELVLTASFYVCVGRTLKSLDVPVEDSYGEAPF